MKYFEIVFDTSGSMSVSLAGSTRIEIAKQLFEKDIFPLIDSSTEVAVRLLRSECQGISRYLNFGTDRIKCLSFIQALQPDGGTPLFNTMKDALQTTLKSGALQKTIFVLTDGGDTCGIPINDILTYDELKYFKQIDVILAQFSVADRASVNQLSHLANTIGAKTFNFGTGYGASLSSIRSELKTALNAVGMNNNEALRHCFEEMPGDLVYWKDVEAMGIQLHQARVLYDEHFLSWKPEYQMHVNPLQLAELKFLFGIRFKTGIGAEMMRTMLSQLIKPYYYSSNCIYWHFEEARWKYFPQPAPIVVERVVEKEVEVERIRNVYSDRVPLDFDSKEWYRKDRLYRIEEVMGDEFHNNINNFVNNPRDMSDIFLIRHSLYELKPKTIKVSPGDWIEFVHKKAKGRPRKKGKI